MGYTPFTISNYLTGLSKERQPWLLPKDAWTTLNDGFVYRGVLNKRQGYTPLAVGGHGSSIACESRMVNRITAEPARSSAGALVTGNGTAGAYAMRLQNNTTTNGKYIRRGTVTITGGANTATDDGAGAFNAPASGTINYTTGDVSVTFGGVVGGGVQITATYDYHPGVAVMGFPNFYTASGTRELLIMDTKRVNKYNTSTNRLDYLGNVRVINAITAANPAAITTTTNHLMVTGDRVFIYGVQGVTSGGVSIINNLEFAVTVTGAATFTIALDTSAAAAYASGGVMQQIYSGTNRDFFTWVNYPDASNVNRLLFANNTNVIQAYDGTGIKDYTYNIDGGITRLTCLQMVQWKGRLILFRTNEDGTIYPQRIRLSGTGASCDDFRTSATGAGIIDIPDESWIMGVAFNRDDIIIFTENSTWIMKYTGNDVVPAVLDKLDESRGCKAPFAAITYLNKTTAASPRGFIGTDGYKLIRTDDKIPDYSFDEIDQDYFNLSFAGAVDQDRDHYLIHPAPGQTSSNKILVTNYEEFNYSVYNIPMSCMGNYLQSYDVTWADLSIYATWAEFAAVYADWNSFAYSAGAPYSVGGGHNGQVWSLNTSETQDNLLQVRNITIVDGSTLEVTTDFNNFAVGDYIYFVGISGMTQLNNKQAAISSITTANTVFRVNIQTAGFSAYTSGGECSKNIQLDAVTKKFNPFVEASSKIRVGWIYFYVSTSPTGLTDSAGDDEDAYLDIDVILNDTEENTQPPYSYRVDCSESSNQQGIKRWYKLFINRTGRFLQFRIRNNQALTTVQVQAMILGVSPAGGIL